MTGMKDDNERMGDDMGLIFVVIFGAFIMFFIVRVMDDSDSIRREEQEFYRTMNKKNRRNK